MRKGRRREPSKNIAREVLVLADILKSRIHIIGVDHHRLVFQPRSAEADLFEQALEHRRQPPGTDVLGAFVDVVGDGGQPGDAVGPEIQGDVLGRQQRLVLLDQRGVGLRQDGFEIRNRQRLQLDPDGEASLQLRNQVARAAEMECARGDEQDMVCLLYTSPSPRDRG